MSEMKKYWKKVYCNKCKVNTNHGIVYLHRIEDGYEEHNFYWTEDYIIGQCMGCDTNNFIYEYDDPSLHFYDHDNGEEIDLSDVKIYPPEPIIDKNKNQYNLKEFQHLPELLDTLYKQVVANFELKYYLLASAGLRMIIEGICNELGIIDGYLLDENSGKITVDKNNNQVRSNSLAGRINGLVEKKLLTENQTSILHIIRKLGNQSVHKLNNPTSKIMVQGLEIIENTLTNIYELKKYDSIRNKLSK